MVISPGNNRKFVLGEGSRGFCEHCLPGTSTRGIVNLQPLERFIARVQEDITKMTEKGGHKGKRIHWVSGDSLFGLGGTCNHPLNFLENGMNDGLKVRAAKREEVPILVDFNWKMAWETEQLELDRARLTAGVRGIFERPERGFYLLAQIGDEVVGMLMVTTEWSDWRNGNFWWIQSVYVAEAFRKRGVFSALYREVRQRASETPDVCGCRLYVEQENTRAQQAYRQKGFKETHYHLYEHLLP